MTIDWSKYKEDVPIDWSQYKEQPEQESGWGSLLRGLKEGYPFALKSGINAASGVIGRHPFDMQQEQPTANWQESLGRGTGKLGGYLSLAAPLAAGGEALIPGLLGASLGSGLAGGLLTEGSTSDKAIGALESSAVPGIGKALSLGARLGKSLIGSATSRKAADVIQKSYDPLREKLSKSFESIGTAADKIGINKIPLEKGMLNEIKEVGPKTKKFQSFVDKAEDGDYKALRQIQTELGKRAERHMSSGLGSEYDVGEKMMEARHDINQAVKSHFEEKGFKNLADKLERNVKGWKELLNTYHSDPVISKLVGENRKVPKNLLSKLEEDSVNAERLRNAHPELRKMLQTKKDKETIKRLMKGSAYRIGAAAATKSLVGHDSSE